MSKTAVITARLDDEMIALVDRLAKARGRTRSWFVAQAVRKAAEAEAELLAFIQEGVDDIEAGRVVSHEDVMAELDAMIASHEARCRD
jgi:predicted transcriptional regulator